MDKLEELFMKDLDSNRVLIVEDSQQPKDLSVGRFYIRTYMVFNRLVYSGYTINSSTNGHYFMRVDIKGNVLKGYLTRVKREERLKKILDES